MNAPIIELRPRSPERVAGSTLEGTVHLPDGWLLPGLSVTLTLTWSTEGKGERDVGEMHVRLNLPTDPSSAIPFSIRLPSQPWSYQGVLLKIHWAVIATVQVGAHSTRAIAPLVLTSPFLRPAGHPHRVAS